MTKKILITSGSVLLLVAIVVSVVVLAGKSENPDMQYSLIEKTFEELVEASNCAAVAELISHKNNSRGIESSFAVQEVLYGEIAEEIIHVEMEKEESQKYTAGEEYILILDREDSLFYDHPLCVVVSYELFIPANDLGNSTLYGKPISALVNRSATATKATIVDLRGAAKPERKSYTKANDLSTIITESDLVLEVKIIDSEDGVYNAALCGGQVFNVLKGAPINSDEEYIMLTMLKGSVKVGKTYIVTANRVEDDSIIYSLSAKNGVIPITDTKKVDEVRRLVARAEQ